VLCHLPSHAVMEGNALCRDRGILGGAESSLNTWGSVKEAGLHQTKSKSVCKFCHCHIKVWKARAADNGGVRCCWSCAINTVWPSLAGSSFVEPSLMRTAGTACKQKA